MASTAIIAQARMGSTRLPGKVLMQLGDRTVLAHVVRRALAVSNTDIVCVATSTLAEDDAVAEEAGHSGAEVFRGEETDVLRRYIGAARMLEADTIMRVTCDCPLLDPEICGQVLRLRTDENVAYASNVGAAQWPHGLDCEAFSAELLERAGREATVLEEREHVTLWMRRNESVRKADLAGPGAPASEQRWTLDYPEDLAFLRQLLGFLPGSPALPGWRDILDTLGAHPELAAINRNRIARTETRMGVLAR